MILKKLLRVCIQSCINSYQGEYGDVQKIFKRREFHKMGHVEMYFESSGNKMFLTFRGSDGILDWKDNFRFWKRSIPYQETGTNKKIRIHTGFYEQYKAIRGKVHDILSIYNLRWIDEIIVTGHSLGGALAILCALDIQYNFGWNLIVHDVKLTCVSFGAPRIGNYWFKKSFEKRVRKHTRVINADDIVTKIPKINYFHVKNKMRIGKRKWWRFLVGSAKDHYPQKYKENLNG
jgi:predicted lipase